MVSVTGHDRTLTSALDRAPAAGRTGGWWRDAVIYQVYIRSFADGNGDGVGDLLGIRTRLPYLKALGVDAVWITPFYTSPMADGGYDVADYLAVDPMFGTLGDFDALAAEAHGLGLRVIVDVVPNHTSDRHQWFVEALASGPGSAARARYVFRDGKGEHGDLPPNDWESVFGGPAWTRTANPDGTPGQWYLHLFDPAQPDLNWDNPQVREDFARILEFWLDRGADGFRVDVAHGMVKHPDLPDIGHPNQITMLGAAVLPYFDQDGVHDIHREWRRILDNYPGERIAVAEAWASSPERLAAYVRPDELHQAFNFQYLHSSWDAPALREVIDSSLHSAGLVGAMPTWVLSNHDVQRHPTRFGGGEVGLRRARAAALLMLALPGSAYVYQGEELGLEEVLDLPEELLQDPQRFRSADGSSGRDGCRVPIPWGGSAPPFHFTPLNITHGWLPSPERWRDLTVEAQLQDPDSVLALYRSALRIRREHPALGDGTLGWLPGPSGTLVFSRGAGFVCTVNTGNQPAQLARPGTVLLSSDPEPLADAGAGTFTLPPDTAVWWTRD